MGNTAKVQPEGFFDSGSSPRVWGTLRLGGAEDLNRRFIPTGVGNTFKLLILMVIFAVHPHGCGEHTNHNRLMLKGKSSLEYSTDFHDF